MTESTQILLSNNLILKPDKITEHKNDKCRHCKNCIMDMKKCFQLVSQLAFLIYYLIIFIIVQPLSALPDTCGDVIMKNLTKNCTLPPRYDVAVFLPFFNIQIITHQQQMIQCINKLIGLSHPIKMQVDSPPHFL